MTNQYTDDQIEAIANLPEAAFRFKTHVDNLLGFYTWTRSQWTLAAVKDFTRQHGLDLRSQGDRCRFAWLAAKEWVACLPPATETKPETKVVRVLSRAIALLKPVPPTNSLENSPAYKIMGSPIYYDELIEGYKRLVRKYHPDLNPTPEATERLQIVTEIYTTLRDGWTAKYSPLIPREVIGEANIKLAYAKAFKWAPESFWG